MNCDFIIHEVIILVCWQVFCLKSKAHQESRHRSTEICCYIQNSLPFNVYVIERFMLFHEGDALLFLKGKCHVKQCFTSTSFQSCVRFSHQLGLSIKQASGRTKNQNLSQTLLPYQMCLRSTLYVHVQLRNPLTTIQFDKSTYNILSLSWWVTMITQLCNYENPTNRKTGQRLRNVTMSTFSLSLASRATVEP